MNESGGGIGARAIGRGLGPFGCTNFGSCQRASRVGWGREPSVGWTAWGLASRWEGLPWGSDQSVLCVEGALLSPTTSAVTDRKSVV